MSFCPPCEGACGLRADALHVDPREQDEHVHTILVPGLACSARLWDTLMPVAWAHGGTTIADTRRDDAITGIAERLLADAPPTFVLAGISMGGYVCLEVMRLALDRVQALALISTSAAPDTTDQLQSRQRQADTTRAGSYDKLVEAAFRSLVDDSNVDNDELKRLWTAMADEVGPEAFIRQLGAASTRRDARPTLPTITCPTAIIHGAGDRTIPVADAHEMAAGIPHANLTVVDGAGHMAAQERCEEVQHALGALLDQVRDAP